MNQIDKIPKYYGDLLLYFNFMLVKNCWDVGFYCPKTELLIWQHLELLKNMGGRYAM